MILHVIVMDLQLNLLMALVIFVLHIAKMVTLDVRMKHGQWLDQHSIVVLGKDGNNQYGNPSQVVTILVVEDNSVGMIVAHNVKVDNSLNLFYSLVGSGCLI